MSADRDVKQGKLTQASWNRLFPLEHPNGHHFGLKYPGGLGGQSPPLVEPDPRARSASALGHQADLILDLNLI